MIVDKEKGLVSCDLCKREPPTHWRHMGREVDDKTGDFIRHLCGDCIETLEKLEKEHKK